MNDESLYTTDCRMMAAALAEARRALDLGEIPIGAVVASGDRIIGRGHNMTEALNDGTAHAETIALTSAANTMGGKYLPDCTLYVTVEPCIMCAGAIGWSQISRIVYGASDQKRGYTSYTPLRQPFHPRAVVAGGLMADECAALMREFFKKLR